MAARRRSSASASLVCVACVALALLSSPASASPAFPDAVRDHLGLSASPACDLCHAKPIDPVGPAGRPFALSAAARGLVGGDVSSLDRALDRMAEDGVDSDQDGAQDLDELWWGGDPNHADVPAGGTPEPIRYGCAVGPGAPAGSAMVLGAALAWGALRRRRARRAKPIRVVDPPPLEPLLVALLLVVVVDPPSPAPPSPPLLLLVELLLVELLDDPIGEHILVHGAEKTGIRAPCALGAARAQGVHLAARGSAIVARDSVSAPRPGTIAIGALRAWALLESR